MRTVTFNSGVVFLCAFALSAQTPLPPQQADQQDKAPASSRAEQIEDLREQKSRTLDPETLEGAEAVARKVQDIRLLERWQQGVHGWRIGLGNLATGAGFAAGPEYRKDNLWDGRLQTRFRIAGATSGSWKVENEWEAPQFAKGWLAFNALAAYRNFNRINFYGTGPDSDRNGRTNYRLEDTSTEIMLIGRKLPRSRVGGILGYQWINVGPGTDSRLASTEQVYSPVQAPGINQQSNFLNFGLFYQFDYRDDPRGPRSGGNYVLQQTWYRDRVHGMYDFRRLDLDLQQYIGFYNKTRRIVLRAKTVMTDSDGNNVVPFYMRPILGGSDDLRGFRPYRFNDRNSIVANAEYQWEVYSGLDAALFVDAGKVAPRRGLINFRDLETSYGFGLRFNARNATFLRLDVGFSREGFQVWFKFNDAFRNRRFGATRQVPMY